MKEINQIKTIWNHKKQFWGFSWVNELLYNHRKNNIQTSSVSIKCKDSFESLKLASVT